MAETKSTVFREKALDRISSPEQLTDYLKVTTPGVWLILTAVILLLGGLFVWSTVGTLETVAAGTAVVDSGTAQIYVTDTSKGEITAGMPVRVGSDEFTISAVSQDDYGRVIASAPVTLTDGKYDVKIVTESITPIRFLFS